MFENLAVVILRAFAAFLGLLPLNAALGVGALLGRLVYHARSSRGISYLNLKAAFEGVYSASQIKAIAKRSAENLGRTVAEVLRFPLVDDACIQTHTTIDGYARVAEALEKKKGLIYVGAHFGNWELPAIRSLYTGVAAKVLVREQKPKKVNEYFNSLRTAHGCELIGRGKGSSVKELIRTLREGSIVAILADQTAKAGVPVEFFGRKTLAPSGFIEIAGRIGTPILPVFNVREKGSFHRIHVLPELAIERNGAGEVDLPKSLQAYYRIVEDFVRRYPDQWLWDHKRWKSCFTKTVFVLTDGKAGHDAQLKALVNLFEDIQQSNPDYQFRIKTARVIYRSAFHRYLLALLTPLVLPWVHQHVDMLRYFLTRECFESIAPIYANFVISCGSSLVPLNLIVSRENKARSIVLMKPSFPFNRIRYDLLVIPRHDLPISARNVIYTDIAPNSVEAGFLKEEGRKLAAHLGLNGKKVLSVLIGGDSRRYSMSREKLAEALDRILKVVKDADLDVLVTTSRRTRQELERIVKQKFAGETCCRLLVIANEHNSDNIVYGMIGVSNVIFVTEDSISMISEAVSSGKPVAVLQVGASRLPGKFIRFRENLEMKNWIQVVGPSGINRGFLMDVDGGASCANPGDACRQAIKEKLVAML